MSNSQSHFHTTTVDRVLRDNGYYHKTVKRPECVCCGGRV